MQARGSLSHLFLQRITIIVIGYRRVVDLSHSDHMHRFEVVPGQAVTEGLHGMSDPSRAIVNVVESHKVVVANATVVVVAVQSDASYY